MFVLLLIKINHKEFVHLKLIMSLQNQKYTYTEKKKKKLARNVRSSLN